MHQDLGGENGKKSILNTRINIQYETQIKCIILMFLYSYLLMYICDLEMYISSLWLTKLFSVGINILWFVSIYFVHRKWGLYQEAELHLRGVGQYICGMVLLIGMFAVYFVIVGTERLQDIAIRCTFFDYLWLIFYYIIVAVTEEYIFRIFFLGEMSIILGRMSAFAPLISAILFGLIHIPQGDLNRAIMTFAYGIVLGYAKQYWKQCTFLSLIMAHGLYDMIVSVLGI